MVRSFHRRLDRVAQQFEEMQVFENEYAHLSDAELDLAIEAAEQELLVELAETGEPYPADLLAQKEAVAAAACQPVPDFLGAPVPNPSFEEVGSR